MKTYEIISKHKSELTDFINKPEIKELLLNNDFEELYHEWVKGDRNILTALLLESDINFLDQMNEIPGFCFEELDIKSLIIPGNIIMIRDDAFRECRSLTSIIIRSGVTIIGFNAFRECSSLTSITIPSSVTSIWSSAFSNCKSLTSITIPSGVTSIGYTIFTGCSNLKTIVFENTERGILSIANVNTIEDFRSFLGINSGCEIIFK